MRRLRIWPTVYLLQFLHTSHSHCNHLPNTRSLPQNSLPNTPVQPLTAATRKTEHEWEEIIFGSAAVADEANVSSEDERPLSKVVRVARASKEASRSPKPIATRKVLANLALPVKTATQSGKVANKLKSSSSVVKPPPVVAPSSTPPIIVDRPATQGSL
ncbi:hypothetical protein C8Q74DRAFT_544755 [Fomes fomentarius]|nr:hypothetical protein C8Q74DRAFT_544755 [Fomes fomentarius]